MPNELSCYFLVRHELAVDAPLIMRGSRLLVPISLRVKIIHLAHEGHQGIVRTKQRLRELYWWPCMDSMVNDMVASCVICQTCDKSVRTYSPPKQPVELPDGPFQKVAIDIVGPFERGSYKCHFAITLVDYFSKWPEVAFVPLVTTETVTTFLASIFAREGNPTSVFTDNGSQFCSSAFSDFLKERGIKQIRTSVYHPQVNGAVERFNLVLKECL